jgi:3-hydroxyisobutyrate dehydrogenase-like beta-hydroxyacid dehydrogenase
MNFGFIGLGNIGLPIARDLISPGNSLTVYDIMPERAEELGKLGARVAASPAEVASLSDIVGVCVRDDKEVRDVIEGADGILGAARSGLVVAIHSTVRITTVKDIAINAEKNGVRIVDAPVTRSAATSSKKSVIFMIGGEPSDVDSMQPFLDLTAARVIKTGVLGTGMALKICNNLLPLVTVVAANDAVRLAEAAGLDVKMLAEVTSANGVASAILTSLLMQRAGAPLPTNIPIPSLESAISIGKKDLSCALDVARDFGLVLPAVAMASDAIAIALSGLRNN